MVRAFRIRNGHCKLPVRLKYGIHGNWVPAV
jgi:hypothetical protein